MRYRRSGVSAAALLVAAAGIALYVLLAERGVGSGLSARWSDKLLQLLCLVPATAALAILIGRHLRCDLAVLLGRGATGLRPWIVPLGLVVLLAVAAVPLARLPGSRDEAQYLFQGRALAAGALTAPAPPCPEAFALRGMIVWRGRWITPYEPGHPLLLGLADRIGLAWVVGPVLGAVALGLTFLLAKELYGTNLATVAAGVGVLSPFFVFLAACHSYHVTSLALASLLLLALARAHAGRPSPRWDYAQGVAGGLLLLVRPLTVGILLPPLALVELHGWRHGRSPWKRGVRMLAAALPFLALLVLYNHAVTGHPLRTARQCVYPRSLFGFGEGAAHGPSYGTVGHTPLKATKNLLLQVGTLSTGLFGWPLLSLVPAAVGFWRTRRTIWSWAFVSSLAVTAGILFFSWYSAVEHGPRHYLDSWPGLVILSAVGMRDAVANLRRRYAAAGSNTAIAAVLGLFLLSFVLYVPVRLHDLTARSLGVDPSVHELAKRKVELPALVFMECPVEPSDYYVSGFVHNDPFLSRPIIYARHTSTEADRACLARFPGRKGYILAYDPHAGPMRIFGLAPARSDRSMDDRL